MVVAQNRRTDSDQKRVLYTLVDPGSAPPKPVRAGLGWSRRVLPPGPKGLLRRPFIAIAGLRRHPEYRRRRLLKKEQGLSQPLTTISRRPDWLVSLPWRRAAPRGLITTTM